MVVVVWFRVADGVCPVSDFTRGDRQRLLADRTRVHLILSVPSAVSASVQLPRIGCRLELGQS